MFIPATLLPPATMAMVAVGGDTCCSSEGLACFRSLYPMLVISSTYRLSNGINIYPGLYMCFRRVPLSPATSLWWQVVVVVEATAHESA